MMNRLFYILLFFGNIAFSQTITGEVYVGTGTPVGGPTITSEVVDNITSTSFRVTWTLSPDATGRVEFYKTDTPETLYYTTKQNTFEPLHIQSPGVNGNGTTLLPNTSYTYRVIGEGEFTGPYQGDWTEVTTLGDNPTATITATDATATELGTTTGTYTVTLSSASVGTTTVNYTVSGTATSGSDFTALSGSVAITDGNTTGTITLTPIDDATSESTETVIVTLASGTGYNIGSPSNAIVNIADDDGSSNPIVTVTATDPTATEESTTTGTFTFTLSAPSSGTTTVNFAKTGTATETTDYASIGSSVDITNGNTTATVTITPVDDAAQEPTESVTLTVIGGTGYDVGSPSSATVNITDNDGSVASCSPGTPVSVTNLAGLTGATPGSTVQINGSINATGATFASNLIIVSGSGTISGTNINLNGACINDSGNQIFANTVTFSSIYTGSRLSPEAFGAVSGDATADDAAIEALIDNCQYATSTLNAVYIKNQETVFNRSGDFDWDMNGAEIRTTSALALSHGTTTDNQHKYLFEFVTLGVRFTNGTFNGQDIASRCIFLNYVDDYYFDNVTIQNYLSPANAYARGTGLKIDIGDNFTGGSFLNGVIENIGATSDGNANNSPYGVSKAISLNVGTQNLSEQLVQNSRIENIYGDDAEGFYYRSKFGYNAYDHATNQAKITFNNNQFIACQRRALKVNASNCDITNNYIESATNDWIFSGAQATLIHIFPLSPQSPLYRVNVIGNTVKTIGDARNPAFGITEANDCLIENNVFEADAIMLQRNVIFGNGSNSAGSNSGYLDDSVIFRNNTITNYFILLSKYMIANDGGMTFTDNTINLTIDRGMGSTWGAFRNAFSAPGPVNGFTFYNTVINVNQTVSTGSTFGGVLCTENADLLNTTWSNVDINYTGTSTPTYPFMIIGTNPGTDMDATNTIINCDITGDVGTAAIGYTGTFGATITNSFGDGATAITAVAK